jgi:hypothetical protein
MHKNNLRPVLLGHTENNYFGNQILQICHDRHAIAATSYHGSESKLNRLRHLPSGHRVLFDCEFGMIHGLGILSDAPATELLRKIRVVKSWNEEEVPEGATIPLWIVVRNLDHFHRFGLPVAMERNPELGITFLMSSLS